MTSMMQALEELQHDRDVLTMAFDIQQRMLAEMITRVLKGEPLSPVKLKKYIAAIGPKYYSPEMQAAMEIKK